MKNRMLKSDWLNELFETYYTDAGPKNKLAEPFLQKEFNKVSKQLYRAFKSTDIKFLGKYRQTDIYAETYRILMGFETSTKDFFDKDFNLKQSVIAEFEQAYVTKRFSAMADKYKEVADLLKAYKNGEIDLKTFTKNVEKFKEKNEYYLKQNYR